MHTDGQPLSEADHQCVNPFSCVDTGMRPVSYMRGKEPLQGLLTQHPLHMLIGTNKLCFYLQVPTVEGGLRLDN
jgi:hypothetical protein